MGAQTAMLWLGMMSHLQHSDAVPHFCKMETQSTTQNLEEVWKDIPNYEGLYKISNLGRVKSFVKKERILRPADNGNGYMKVCLCKNGKQKYFLIHRLVYESFTGSIDRWKLGGSTHDILEINHKNEIKTDNRLENLELVTHKYNVNYGARTDIAAEKNGVRIYQYNEYGKLVKIWRSIRKCKLNHNFSQKKEYTISGGYLWSSKYLQEKECLYLIKKHILSGLRFSKKVYQYDNMFNLIKKWNNTTELTENGFASSNITKCCNGKKHSYKGYFWLYEDVTVVTQIWGINLIKYLRIRRRFVSEKKYKTNPQTI